MSDQINAPQPDMPPVPQPPICPPFHPATLQFQMNMDAAMRWGSVALMGGAVVLASLLGADAQWPFIVALVVAAAWIGISVSSARVWQMIPRISLLLDQSPPLAEAQIAVALRRRALHRTVRLLLYHRLAVLRHRQQRFAEAAAICQSLLSYNLGAARQVESHLLLLLAECRLIGGDLYGAWETLGRLSTMRLSLSESAQRMALQTRYEVAAGYYQIAVHNARQKVQLAELMPPAQCGALHALLAFAAYRCDHPQLAHWLQQRAELLCTPDQMHALAQGGAPINPANA